MKLVERACPLCGGGESRLFLEEAGYRYVRCLSCGFMYLNPRPSDEDLYEHYQDYLPASAEEIEAWRRSMTPLFLRSARHIGRLVRAPGRLLDVGTGFGFFPSIMAGLGWDATGMEISGPGADYAEGRLGVKVVRKTLEEAGFEGGMFDAVTAFYVIEHLSDPARACGEALRILKPGGVLLLRWPHTAPLSSFTRAIGLNLGLMHAPSHLNQFSPGSMKAMLERSGFGRVRTAVGGWTWPRKPLWRIAGVGGGILAEAAGIATFGKLLIPGVSKTTVAFKD